MLGLGDTIYTRAVRIRECGCDRATQMLMMSRYVGSNAYLALQIWSRIFIGQMRVGRSVGEIFVRDKCAYWYLALTIA